MKKFLLSLAAAAIALGAAATTVKFDLTDPESFGVARAANNERVYPESIAKDGVTIVINNPEEVADNAKICFFTSSSGAVDFRCGKSNKLSSIVVTAPENITAITFTGTGDFAEVKNNKWTGDAASVTLSRKDTSGQLKITAMEVTYGEKAAETPDPVGKGDGTLEKPYNASQAYELAAALDESGSIADVYVKGIIINIKEVSTSYGNATYTIADNATDTEGFSIFRGYWLDGAKFTKEDQIQTGATVIVKGTLVNYKGNTPQITTGSQIVNYNGKTSDEPEQPVEPSVTTVKSVKETIALESGAAVKVEYALTVGWVFAKNVFVCDEAGDFIQIYGTNSLKVGDVIPAGWEGTYKLFNNVTPEIELGTTVLPAATAGTFAPKTVAANAITNAMVNQVVKINDVVFEEATPAEKVNFTGKVGETVLNLRNNYTLESVPAGTYSVTVVVTVFNNEPSLYVTNYEKTMTSVDNVAVDANAPAEYFNLQGVRVAQPENGGLYIRRQAGKTVKVLVK